MTKEITTQQKPQRLVPVLYLEAMVGFLLLQLQVEKEAIKSALGLRLGQEYCNKFTGHLQIMQEVNCNWKAAAILDYVVKRSGVKTDQKLKLEACWCFNVVIPYKSSVPRHMGKLVWVPGHVGIADNKDADEVGRKGTTISCTGPEFFCGQPISAHPEILRALETGWRRFYWKTLPGL